MNLKLDFAHISNGKSVVYDVKSLSEYDAKLSFQKKS
jgi:hypothetical protein